MVSSMMDIRHMCNKSFWAAPPLCLNPRCVFKQDKAQTFRSRLLATIFFYFGLIAVLEYRLRLSLTILKHRTQNWFKGIKFNHITCFDSGKSFMEEDKTHLSILIWEK